MFSRCLNQTFRATLPKLTALTSKTVGLCQKISAVIKVFTLAIACAASPDVQMTFGASKRSSVAPEMDTPAASAGKHSAGGRSSGGTSASTPEKSRTRVLRALKRSPCERVSAATRGSTRGRGRTPARSAVKAFGCETI